MCPLFLNEIDAVQRKHSLHLQIFVSFVNQCYLFISSLYYGFNLRNGIVQPLTPNFKTCLTSTCIVTKTRYCFSVTYSLDMDYNPCEKSIQCPSPHSKITYNFLCGIKSPPPTWLTVLIVDGFDEEVEHKTCNNFVLLDFLLFPVNL